MQYPDMIPGNIREAIVKNVPGLLPPSYSGMASLAKAKSERNSYAHKEDIFRFFNGQRRKYPRNRRSIPQLFFVRDEPSGHCVMVKNIEAGRIALMPNGVVAGDRIPFAEN